jgi:hypothetical protein
MPIRFNYKGICLSACPDNDLPSNLISAYDYVFTPDYDQYTCVESKLSIGQNQTGNLRVRLVPMGYRKRLPKDQILYFRVAVANVYGNLTKVQWKQMEPH